MKGLARKKPALLISTSTLPKCWIATSNMRCEVAGSAISPATVTKLCGLPSSPATSFRLASERELPTTLKPRLRYALTSPRPMPLEAPVTMTVLGVLMIRVLFRSEVMGKELVLQGFAVFGGGHSGVAPVIGVDFFDDDVGQVRAFAEYALQGVGDFGDDLGFLIPGNTIAGNTNADERHGWILAGRSGPLWPRHLCCGPNYICAMKADKQVVRYFT